MRTHPTVPTNMQIFCTHYSPSNWRLIDLNVTINFLSGVKVFCCHWCLRPWTNTTLNQFTWVQILHFIVGGRRLFVSVYLMKGKYSGGMSQTRSVGGSLQKYCKYQQKRKRSDFKVMVWSCRGKKLHLFCFISGSVSLGSCPTTLSY